MHDWHGRRRASRNQCTGGVSGNKINGRRDHAGRRFIRARAVRVLLRWMSELRLIPTTNTRQTRSAIITMIDDIFWLDLDRFIVILAASLNLHAKSIRAARVFAQAIRTLADPD